MASSLHGLRAVNQQECIVIFVRSPEKGRVKTRLTAVLDKDMVVDLYRRFALDLLGTLRQTTLGLRICFYPAEAKGKVADWLGEDYVYTAQQGRDLGERLENAFISAFADGFRRVVIIGSDSPDLPGEILEEAISRLTSKDAVIGPAVDGGYYLIGFNSGRFLTEVFRGVEWGTSTVFERTMDCLSKHDYSVAVLPRWRDIDTYEDVVTFMRKHELTPAGRLLTLDYLRERKKRGAMNRCDISVVIPVFREEEPINETVDALYGPAFDGRLEIIVVDGDPEESTLKAIRDPRVKKIPSEKGRGRQMNAGALLAGGEVLLFLHADTELPPDGLTRICSVIRDKGCVGGSFDLGIRSDRLCFRFIESAASLRSRMTRIPYGDQAIFLRRDYFRGLGGFRELPLMEDVDLMRRLRRSGGRIHIIRDKVKTSARRWESEGVLYCTLRNWMLMFLYLLGISPERLARLYQDHNRNSGKDKNEGKGKNNYR